ncbi:MAG: hypothetical protein Q9219_004651 [cf. Caloplaca sp. 3 TL-2023]
MALELPPLSSAWAATQRIYRATFEAAPYVFWLGTTTGSRGARRYLFYLNPHIALVFYDGSIHYQGDPNEMAGYGVTCSPDDISYDFGTEFGAHNPGHAELTAVIHLLETIPWLEDGIGGIVLASHNTYVIEGVEHLLLGWAMAGWRDEQGQSVPNRDLWQRLLEMLNFWDSKGMLVQFWWISEELNLTASELRRIGV